jgi:hypothetical protein
MSLGQNPGLPTRNGERTLGTMGTGRPPTLQQQILGSRKRNRLAVIGPG